MNRIKASLALIHLLCCGGFILFYTTGSPLGVLIAMPALFMRAIAPIQENTQNSGFGLWSTLGIIWTVGLITWLGDHGMHEVLEAAYEARLAPLPFTLFMTFLMGMVIQEWRYVLNLSEAEIDQYYLKEPQP